MAFTAKQLALTVSILGAISFILGIVAENKKPPVGIPVAMSDKVVCNYPSDPSVVLGYLSFAFLVASSAIGYFSLFYPYKGKQIPRSIFFKSGHFLTFSNIALFTSGLAATLTLWPTIQEQYHIKNNVYPIPGPESEATCPTAKTGLLGGGAFVSLDSTLFWLVLLMISVNVREDFFDDSDVDPIRAQVASPITIY